MGVAVQRREYEDAGARHRWSHRGRWSGRLCACWCWGWLGRSGGLHRHGVCCGARCQQHFHPNFVLQAHHGIRRGLGYLQLVPSEGGAPDDEDHVTIIPCLNVEGQGGSDTPDRQFPIDLGRHHIAVGETVRQLVESLHLERARGVIGEQPLTDVPVPVGTVAGELKQVNLNHRFLTIQAHMPRQSIGAHHCIVGQREGRQLLGDSEGGLGTFSNLEGDALYVTHLAWASGRSRLGGSGHCCCRGFRRRHRSRGGGGRRRSGGRLRALGLFLIRGASAGQQRDGHHQSYQQRDEPDRAGNQVVPCHEISVLLKKRHAERLS